MKSIILCADDYGQTTAISQAIIQLLQQKRLSATSCMTTSPFWQLHSQWLKSPNIQADIGLHINLTEGKPLSPLMLDRFGNNFPKLSELLMKTHLKRIDFNVIFAEVNAQIDEFERNMGFLPHFIDGHQHVHQLPIIRDVVLKIYDTRLRQDSHCYVRCIDDQHVFFRIKDDAYIKRCIIQLSGASAFKKQLQLRKIPHNTSFAGIYNFKNVKSYSQIFFTFLKQIKNNGLIMCHPGLKSDRSDNDPIFYSREEEYRYFLSDAFLEVCQQQHVVLKRSFFEI